MNHPFAGFFYFIDGLRLITQPGLKRFVLVPLFINLLLFLGLFFISKHFFAEFNHWFEHWLPSWLHWLSVILWMVFFIGFFLVVIFTFVTITNLITAPFNSFLAEKVEFYLTGNRIAPRTGMEIIKDIPRLIGRQLAIIGYYLPRALVLLLLFFVPIIQIMAALLWFLFNAWFMTLQHMDYPTDNHQIPLSVVHTKLREKRWASFGFGISVLIFTMIPILNCVSIPAAVAGAVKFWIEENK